MGPLVIPIVNVPQPDPKYSYKSSGDTPTVRKPLVCRRAIVLRTDSSPKHEHRLESSALDPFNPDKNQFLELNRCTAMK